MAPPRKDAIEEKDLYGLKHFKLLVPALAKLHDDGCQRDKAGNRVLHYDQYAALILLYFFNPIVTSLRGIQQTSQLQKVQRLLGCSRAALGSLSEAARVFDPELLRGVMLGVPRENAPEAAVVDAIQVIGIGTLAEAVGFLEDRLPLEPTCVDINEVFAQASHYDIDFSDVRGQESAKRAITIAAAGAHNILTLGTSARYGVITPSII